MFLHLFAAFVAASTALLIFAGGLVTSTGSGLSVPDWPTTYGWFMLTFPLDKMVGGIFYEHTHRFSTREVMVPFKCDVHPWMRAYIGVLDHPYFAVSGADGAFNLKGLSPGTYTIEAWHETLGTQTQTVTIGARESGTVAFSFKATT